MTARGTVDAETLTRLAKLLRMLTSSHDGEVLAAANRINGLIAGLDADWGDLLGGARSGADLTREQLQRVYDAGYQKGVEDGAKRPREDDWASAGTSRTGEIGDQIKEVHAIIGAAVKAAQNGRLNDFELSFTQSMAVRISDWGLRAFVSEKQWAVLTRLRNKLEREGYL